MQVNTQQGSATQRKLRSVADSCGEFDYLVETLPRQRCSSNYFVLLFVIIASASAEQPWARVMSSLPGCVTWAVDLLRCHPGPSRDEDAMPHKAVSTGLCSINADILAFDLVAVVVIVVVVVVFVLAIVIASIIAE